jgi:hypothetical protein
MRPEVFAAAVATLALALAVHVAWWRWARPRADIPAILTVFLVAPAIAYLALALRPLAASSTGAWLALSPVECLAAYVLHAAIGAAYVQTYPATQARSPTLAILMALGRTPEGLDRAGIVAALDASGLVGERVEDLQRNALVRREGDRLVLTGAGRVLARAFGAYRRWLGLGLLGG